MVPGPASHKRAAFWLVQGTSSVHSALQSCGHLSAAALSWACHTLLCSGSLEATPGSHGHHTNLGSYYIAASDLAGVTLENRSRNEVWSLVRETVDLHVCRG